MSEETAAGPPRRRGPDRVAAARRARGCWEAGGDAGILAAGAAAVRCATGTVAEGKGGEEMGEMEEDGEEEEEEMPSRTGMRREGAVTTMGLFDLRRRPVFRFFATVEDRAGRGRLLLPPPPAAAASSVPVRGTRSVRGMPSEERPLL